MFYERRHHRLAPIPVFVRRLLASVSVSGSMIFGTLLIGMAGYHWVAGFAWIDALHNAAMILGGMGPVDPVRTVAAKLFASLYALFCGLVFVGAMGLVISPILHRMVHRFHLDEEEAEREAKKGERP
jgi:hypothetical protein